MLRIDPNRMRYVTAHPERLFNCTLAQNTMQCSHISFRFIDATSEAYKEMNTVNTVKDSNMT